MTQRKLWHAGDYASRARRLMLTVRATSRCWRCERLLADCRPHKNRRAAFWTAGHVDDSDPLSELRLECSTCNFSHGDGQRTGRNHRRNGNPTSRQWFVTQSPQRP